MANLFGDVVNKVGSVIIKKSPTILMVLGIGGCVSATIIAIKETPKALRIMEDRKKELEVEKLPVEEIVKSTWKIYLPVVVTGTLSIVCILFSHSLNEKRKAALATLYTISETAMSEYRYRVRDEFPEKDFEIASEVNDKIEERFGDILNDLDTEGKSPCVISPMVWIKEPITGQEFFSSENEVRTIITDLNEEMIDGNDYVSVNEYLDSLGLNESEVFGEYEWNVHNSGTFRARFPEYIKRSDGLPMLVMKLTTFPRPPIKYGD